MNEIFPADPPDPPDKFWEDDLEMPVASLWAAAESDEFMKSWLDDRSAPQVAMLRHLLRLANVPPRSRRKELQDCVGSPSLRFGSTICPT
jgi:hypothetical protein